MTALLAAATYQGQKSGPFLHFSELGTFVPHNFFLYRMSIFSPSEQYLHRCLRRQTRFSASTAFEGAKICAYLRRVLAGIT